MSRGRLEPLFRKVNTRARGVHHRFGGDFAGERHAKAMNATDATHLPMNGDDRRGLDYTPLFRFLLSREDEPWGQTFSDAVARLDQTAPIFEMVALRAEDRKGVVRGGDNSYYSGMFVDDDGILRRVAPDITVEQLVPSCDCCTHTFNGVPYVRRRGSSA